MEVWGRASQMLCHRTIAREMTGGPIRGPILGMYVLFFFFSSRRRHTRCSRDWSSDVCSSDLICSAEHQRIVVAKIPHVGNSPYQRFDNDVELPRAVRIESLPEIPGRGVHH